MSKWTLEKILACDEIKFGTMFSFENEKDKRLVVSKDKNIFYSIVESGSPLGITSWTNEEDIEGIYFYNFDGTEIEPPKDKKKIKIDKWINIYNVNDTNFIISYNSKEEADLNGLTRIACEHFEREIEVDE